MKDRLLMVVGVGGGKVLPILFGAYLSRFFGGNSISDFVLVGTYVSALSAVSTMGSTPQIIRAEATGDAAAHVVAVASCALLITLLAVLVSTGYWFFASGMLLQGGGVVLQSTIVAAFAFSLVFYSIGQATLNQRGHHGLVGVWSLGVYAGAIAAGGLMGRISSYPLAILAYGVVFMLLSFLFFWRSQHPFMPAWGSVSTRTLLLVFSTGFRHALSASLFGVITLAGFFLIMKTVHARLSAADRAIFSVSFQLFQAGIFVPSVLGAIVVPKMVSAELGGGRERSDRIHRATLLVYLGIGLLWLLLMSGVAAPLLSVYGLNATKHGVLALLLMQASVVLAAIQAFYIQRFVAYGRFGLLAVSALVWALSALGFLAVTAPGLMMAALAFVLAYASSLSVYVVAERLPGVASISA